MRQITIQQNDAGQRLDKFLAKSMPALPKGLCANSSAPSISSGTASAAPFPTGWSRGMC